MSKSLYEQLKAGTPAEDIAAAFTAELNKAEEQLRAEREAEEKAKAQEATDKLNEAVELLRNVMIFISRYYPSFGLEDGELTEDEYRALAELLLLMLDLEAIKPAKRQFKVKSYTKPAPEPEPEAKPSLDDAFTDFFKTFGL